FFYYMPKTLWTEIAEETNRYERQTRPERLRQAKLSIEKKTDDIHKRKEMFQAKKKELDAFKDVLAAEIMHFLALVISRAICPIKSRLEDHWKTRARGAIPAGTWSPFMVTSVSRRLTGPTNTSFARFLHFTNNQAPQAKTDRAWKIRNVINKLKTTFKGGMELGRLVAFDEMVIPSRSSRNKIRVFLKNKPHKYGTKLFAVCWGKTHYCSRYAHLRYFI
ncbi:hypothetical protein PHYSODRAFT_534902, partial [Phytophthora sojae]